jgi:hypothetical protein
LFQLHYILPKNPLKLSCFQHIFDAFVLSGYRPTPLLASATLAGFYLSAGEYGMETFVQGTPEFYEELEKLFLEYEEDVFDA